MSRERYRRILFSSGIGLAQRIAQLLSTLVTLPLTLHALGVAGFGIWAAATSLAWLSGVLDLGLGSALLTLLPESIAKGQSDKVGSYVAASLAAGSALTIIIFAVCGLLLWVGAVHAPGMPFLVAGIALALNIPIGIGRDVWFGLQKGYVAGYWDFAQTLLTLGLLIATAIAGGGVAAMVTAVYVAILLTNLASLAHLVISHKLVRPSGPVSVKSIRIVAGRGSLLLAITIAGACAYSLDTLMALTWLGPVAAAQMAVVIRVCTTAAGILNIITQPLWPEFVEAVTVNDRPWLRRVLRDGTLGLAAMACAGSLVIVACGAPILRLWLHQDLHLSQPLLWVMGGWIVASNLGRISSLLLNAALVLWRQIFITVACTAVGLPLKFLAAKMFGVIGILGVSPALWAIVVVPAYFWLGWCATECCEYRGR
jgi:O-antigen/teichoic acid export membrane protein